jgi:hypothetical protein
MWDKIESLESLMEFFLKGISQGTKFNIWSFGSSYTAWSPLSVDYSERALEAALPFVNSDFWAYMSGTELLAVLEAIERSKDSAISTDVTVPTDGQVWRLGQTLRLIRDTRSTLGNRIRLFFLGVSDHVSPAPVEGIAKAGGGYAKGIPAASQAGWEDRVVAMTKAALTARRNSHLDIVIEWEGRNGESHGKRRYVRDRTLQSSF